MNPEPTPPWTKEALRGHIRQRLRALSPAELEDASARLIARLRAHPRLAGPPGTIALFGGLRAEPDLVQHLLPWLHTQGWRTVLFAMEGNALLPIPVSGLEDLERAALGVWAPVRTPSRSSLPPEALDLILVPGLAFDPRTGARLGRGGGYYDRYLAQPGLRASLLGIAYSHQILPGVPTEAHDTRVPEIVTETGVLQTQAATR